MADSREKECWGRCRVGLGFRFLAPALDARKQSPSLVDQRPPGTTLTPLGAGGGATYSGATGATGGTGDIDGVAAVYGDITGLGPGWKTGLPG